MGSKTPSYAQVHIALSGMPFPHSFHSGWEVLVGISSQLFPTKNHTLPKSKQSHLVTN